MTQERQWRVGIFLFNEVEVLDFAGPFEVFSIATYENNNKVFKVNTISETGEKISARNGLKVVPDYSFEDDVQFDIVIIPGGYGAEEIEIKNKKVIDWIKKQHDQVEVFASVCTGAFLLAEAGLLNNKTATTHWMDLDILQNKYPQIKVVKNIKYVQEGKIVTAAGISAGINMSFFIISNLTNKDIARATAKRMEYDIEI